MNGGKLPIGQRSIIWLATSAFFLSAVGIILLAVQGWRQASSTQSELLYLGLLFAVFVSGGVLVFLPYWSRRMNRILETTRSDLNPSSRLLPYFSHHPRPHFTADRSGKITSINPAMEAVSGTSRHEIIGQNFESFVLPHNLGKARRRFKIVLEGRPQLFELECRTPAGNTFLAEISAIPIDFGANIEGAYCAIRDKTQEHNEHEEMKMVWTAFHNAYEAILLCDRAFHIIAANRTYLALTGFDWSDVERSKPDFLEHGNQGELIGKSLEAKGEWKGELYFNRPSGSPVLANTSISVVNGDDQYSDRIVVTLNDVTEFRELQGDFEYLTMRDPLTGLPNWRALTSWFSFRKSALEDNQKIAIAYIDLHRFRAINSLFGHEFGNELLSRFANYLEATRDEDSYVARFQGDEFIYAKARIHAKSDLRDLITTIDSALRKASSWDQKSVSVTAHIGVSIYPDHGQLLEDLLRAADLAVYEAEHIDSKLAVFFNESMKERLERRLSVERLLPLALDNDELDLVYQPILNLEEGRITGAEALLRWTNPILGSVSPIEFIPLAERLGFMSDIGEWVLETTCREAAYWCGQWPSLRHISINISTYELLRRDFVRKVCNHVAQNEILRGRLVLEITEWILMSDPERAITIIRELHEAGIGVAIDDFGTGYSSLNYLRRLPVKYLKIDRAFVNNIPENEIDTFILRTIINLSHYLGVRVVAEGVELEEQLNLLRSWGCDEAQGYLIARPMSADKVVNHFRNPC